MTREITPARFRKRKFKYVPPDFEINKGDPVGNGLLVEVTKGIYKGREGRLLMPRGAFSFGGKKGLSMKCKLESGKIVLLEGGQWKEIKEEMIYDAANKIDQDLADEAKRKAADKAQRLKKAEEKLAKKPEIYKPPLPTPEPKENPLMVFCAKCKRDVEILKTKEDGKFIRGRCARKHRVQGVK